MSSTSRRHNHGRSPAAPPMDDDNLLGEILLRLPPQPSSLPRASAVCKRWRRLVSDPGFFRRFCLRHHRNPPLLGFFDRFHALSFLPTLESPNRIPPGRFSLQLHDDANFYFSLGCRHGLVLFFLPDCLRVLVWDPVTGDQHRIAAPPDFAINFRGGGINGAVLRAAGDVQHFQVVLVFADNKDMPSEQILALVYSSKTGLWGDPVSTPILYPANVSHFFSMDMDDAVLAGHSLYWKVGMDMPGILEFDLEKQILAMIQVPADMYGKGDCLKVMKTEGGGLGFLFVSTSDYTALLWKRKTDCDGVASWGLTRTIELDKLIFLKPEEKEYLIVVGFAEENNAVFLLTLIGLFMIDLDSLKLKKLCESMIASHYHPFERVYTSETCAGGGNDTAEFLLSA